MFIIELFGLAAGSCRRLGSAHSSQGGATALNLLGALTGLVSVIVTGLVAFLTLQRAHKDASSRRSHEFLLAILPRRLNAFENTWRMIFELESGTLLTPEYTKQLVEVSIWLPRDLRDELITVIAHPDKLTAPRVSSIRRQLEDSSGAAQIDALQSKLIEVPPFHTQKVKP